MNELNGDKVINMKNENEMNGNMTPKGVGELHGGFKTFKIGLKDLESKGLNHQFKTWIENNVGPLFKEEWKSIEIASKILAKEPMELVIWATSHYWWLDYKDLDILDDNLIGDEKAIKKWKKQVLVEADDVENTELFYGINKLMGNQYPNYWHYHLKEHFEEAIEEGRDIECLLDEAEELIGDVFFDHLGTCHIDLAYYMLENDNRLSIENIVRAFDEAEFDYFSL